MEEESLYFSDSECEEESPFIETRIFQHRSEQTINTSQRRIRGETRVFMDHLNGNDLMWNPSFMMSPSSLPPVRLYSDPAGAGDCGSPLLMSPESGARRLLIPPAAHSTAPLPCHTLPTPRTFTEERSGR